MSTSPSPIFQAVVKPPQWRGERGSTLVVSLFIIALIATFIGLALDYTSSTARNAVRSRDLTTAQALADGALEAAYMKWQVYMAGHQSYAFKTDSSGSNPNGTFATYTEMQSTIGNPVRAALNSAVNNSGFSVTELDIHPVDQADNPIDYQNKSSASTGPLPNTPGWIATSYSYRARAVVAKTGVVGGDPIVVSVSRYFQQADAPLFQAMLFFQHDLELHPGPNMTLYGLVHTNANMYAVAGSGGGLTFTSNVSYTVNPPPNPAKQRPSNYYQSSDTEYIEGVTQTLYDQEGSWSSYKNPVYPSTMSNQLSAVKPLDPLGLSTIPTDSTNPNDTGTHEIIERPVPTSTSTTSTITADTSHADQIASHRLFNNANLRILINRGKNNGGQVVRVYQPGSSNAADSIEIPATGNAATSPNANITDKVIAAITPDNTGAITDMREGRVINVDTVDVSKLVTPLNGYSGNNGVVYISDITNAGTDSSNVATYAQTGNSDAIRLTKGGKLPDSGLTVVSDGGVYVQGDYNTGTTYDATTGATIATTLPNSDLLGDPTQYALSGYTPKPAAVVGDAVMILSNSWNDALSSQQSSARVASATTFNAALVSGQVLTNTNGNGKGSGGAHNFPRFLEDWSNKNFTYHGSMVELYESKHFTGYYGKSNVYSPPIRRWYFDDSFLTNPPPGNLRATNYVRGRWTRNTLTGNEPTL